MRLWSLHPRLLDSRGLVACWRESLLAQKVLAGDTKGYRHRPQLLRFRSLASPEAGIATYLRALAREADRRGYHFDHTKISDGDTEQTIPVTRDQLHYEWALLGSKAEVRSADFWRSIRHLAPSPGEMFSVAEGPIEAWEVIQQPIVDRMQRPE